jgi:hypothetical protein
MPQFHETIMGKRYYESTLPSIARSLEKIAEKRENTPHIDYKEVALEMISRGVGVTENGVTEGWSDVLLDILEEKYHFETLVKREVEDQFK